VVALGMVNAVVGAVPMTSSKVLGVEKATLADEVVADVELETA